VFYVKHVQDILWEDNSPPDLKGSAQINYLRMKYLVNQMMKY